MSELLAASADEVQLARRVLLEATGSAADTPIQVVLASSPTIHLNKARELVRDADIRERTDLATRFAERAKEHIGVRDVILAGVEPELDLVVVVDDLDMDRELALYATFIDLTRELPDPSIGDLRVVGADEGPLPDGDSLI